MLQLIGLVTQSRPAVNKDTGEVIEGIYNLSVGNLPLIPGGVLESRPKTE